MPQPSSSEFNQIVDGKSCAPARGDGSLTGAVCAGRFYAHCSEEGYGVGSGWRIAGTIPGVRVSMASYAYGDNLSTCPVKIEP